MRFERVAVGDALGALAAHTVSFGSGVVKKGTVFDAEAVEALRRAGVDNVYAARLSADDVHENEAARQIAKAIAGPGVSVDALATGRVNLRSDAFGLATIDTTLVDELNSVYEGITVATVPAYAKVETRHRVATIKIVPFAVPARLLEKGLALCARAPGGVAVAPFAARRVGLVLTRISRTTEAQLAKSRRVISERVEALGSEIAGVTVCPHEPGPVAEALSHFRTAECDLMIALGGAAIADRDDVVPAGLVQAGGRVSHLGMPVEPGNLLMLGSLEDIPVIGAPSCARVPKENGFDWVLERLLAGLDVGPRDIMRLGVGGLLF